MTRLWPPKRDLGSEWENFVARTLVRYLDAGTARWGILVGEHIAVLPFDVETTGQLFRDHWDALSADPLPQPSVERAGVRLLCPITPRQQFVCQGVNYRSHVRESGLRVENIPFNMIFTKASSSLTAADAEVVRPPHVRLLDYEIELGLVVRRDLTSDARVDARDLGQWLAGVVVVNDLSARDVQLPQGQFYKGKSYRGFGPVGPGIVLLEPSEWSRLPDLHMRLRVNGQTRQDAYCREMIYTPERTLAELAGLQDLHAGDLIATGTPAGCAARAPGKIAMFAIKHLFSDAGKWRMFVRKGLNNSAYLQPGDRIEASIRTDDGAIDLGTQTTRIVAA